MICCCTGIIFSTFQGKVRTETQQVVVRPDASENQKPVFDIDRGARLFLMAVWWRLMPLLCRDKGNNVAVPVPRRRPTSTAPFSRRGGEEHHPPSRHSYRSC